MTTRQRMLQKREGSLKQNPAQQTECFSLSDGEIHYLWHFIQGSIMNPGVRHRLKRGWGFCQRHAWGNLVVESAFRQEFFHGPAILYEDIMGLAQEHLKTDLWHKTALRLNLKMKGPCLMCDMGYGPQSVGHPMEEVLKQGRNVSNFQNFAYGTQRYWGKYVCRICLGDQTDGHLCRPHLLSKLSQGQIKDIEIEAERYFVHYLSEQLRIYARSFRWERRGTETVENKASLIGAVGWCSGWNELFKIIQ
jgi:hypothetical protein